MKNQTIYEILTPTCVPAAMLNRRVQEHPYFSNCKIHASWSDELTKTLYDMNEGAEKESLMNEAIDDLIAMNEAVARGECIELKFGDATERIF